MSEIISCTVTIDALNGSGTIRNGSSVAAVLRALNIGVAGGSGTFSGNIDATAIAIGFSYGGNPNYGAGLIAITKIGSGTQTLSGTNPYTGNTTIIADTLALSGGALITNSAAIVVVSNAIFNVSGLGSAFTLAQSLSS